MKTLVATGGAEHSQLAVKQIALWAEAMSLDVTVMTVIANDTELERANQLLSSSAAFFDRPVSKKISIGKIADQIIKVAQDGEYDLIVLGQRPQHSWQSRIFGIVAENVVTHAPCSVLIVQGQLRHLHHLLLCDSGKKPSVTTKLVGNLQPFLKIVDFLTILHVMSQISSAPEIPGEQLTASAEELIAKHTPEGTLFEEDIAQIKPFNVEVNVVARHGLVVEEIAQEAALPKYDLVVLGAHEGEGNWIPAFLLADLARQLVRLIHCDILVAR